MKNIFSTLNFLSLKENLLKIIKRFPVSILLLIALNALLFIALHQDLAQSLNEKIVKSIFTVVVTFFLSLWFYVASEGMELSNIKKNILQLAALLFWLVFYAWFNINFNSFDNMTFFILTLLWIISLLFFAPFLKKLILKEDVQGNYYSYFYNTSVVFLISTILWWILFVLWNIWISAIFELFDLKWIVDSKIYGDWDIIALSFITPIFALTKLPQKESFNESLFTQNVFYSFLVKYIAIPFIYIYFIILYAYSIKVLLNFKAWPNWEVSWMVIWFSIFWYLIYMFSYIFEDTIKFIRLFRKLFPYFVVPQLFMLFYAIYLRIAQYDITMNRYFIVVFGIWLLINSLYFIFSSRKSLACLPFTLTIFTIIISIWPWWVYLLPESRQLIRLENNLKTAWILKNWEIVPLKDYEGISHDLSIEIYSSIKYLCNNSNCESIKKIFPKQYSLLEKKHNENLMTNQKQNLKNGVDEISSWEIIDEITKEIKVKSYFDDNVSSTISFTAESEIFPIDILWYSKIYRIWYENMSDSCILKITQNWSIIDTLDASKIEDELIKKYNEHKETMLKKEGMTFELKWSKWSYKVIFDRIEVKNPLNKTDTIKNGCYNMSGYILVK